MNKSDSERVRTVIEQLGYTWTDNEENASLIGILACSVRQKAIDKVYSRIHKWNVWKKKRSLLTFLTGCVLTADREKMLKLFDFVFEMEALPDLENILRQYGVASPVSIEPPVNLKQNHAQLGNFWKIDPTYTSEFDAFVPIQNGCDKFCTFCAVPYTRGREVSRPSGEILDEISRLIERKYKSITLLGQNVNSYGRDKKGNEISFPELLAMIGQVCDDSGKEVWIYFTSPHPRDMSDEVIKVISRYKSLAKQIHLPVQSGDDEVLHLMNRNHSISKYREIVSGIRQYIPGATIFTDIIVGFTGETDIQFENTRKIMEEFRFNMAYIAIYSPRPGAVSSEWPDNVPQSVKKERLFILSDELRKYSSEYNRQMIGKTVRVLVTGNNRKEGFLSGYSEGKIIVRFPSDNNNLIGQFVDLAITSSAEFSVEGLLSPVKTAQPIEK